MLFHNDERIKKNTNCKYLYMNSASHSYFFFINLFVINVFHNWCSILICLYC